ncbi:MAG: EAL domain-containing protein, partial [Betaproteobacteria bacterium]|nr:EAL domain-containing protein [Betaproteobacteria bacterium]
IALDDFGTEYSSLGYLKQFPLDYMKIDQCFVRGIPQSKDDSAITKTIITLAKNLGLRVIAEGVETQEQMAFLAENGCEEIQGYLFSRPISGAETENVLIANLGKSDLSRS